MENNLYLLRMKLGHSQEDFAKLVDIKRANIAKYESNAYQIPVDKAIKISKKCNVTLDWLYCNEKSNSKNFMIDIRELITCDENNIYIALSSKHMEYINKMLEIENMNEKERIKYHELSKITNQYIEKEDDNIICKAVIPKSNFLKYFCDTPFGDDKNQNKTRRTPTKNEIKEVVELLEDTGEEETGKIKIKLK